MSARRLPFLSSARGLAFSACRSARAAFRLNYSPYRIPPQLFALLFRQVRSNQERKFPLRKAKFRVIAMAAGELPTSSARDFYN
jgi:hypothetical protein